MLRYVYGYPAKVGMILIHNLRSLMNKIEHLLVCLSEECSEVIKLVDKSLRFGIESDYLGDLKGTNKQEIIKELNDIQSVIELLNDNGIDLQPNSLDEQEIAIEKKKTKVLRYMEYAKSIGTLRED